MEELTKREQEVLEVLCQGLNYKEASEKLYISPKTMRSHVNNLFGKLQVNNRTQLVLAAINNGLVFIDTEKAKIEVNSKIKKMESIVESVQQEIELIKAMCNLKI